MPERSCTDCRWAKWERTKSGRIEPGSVGKCTYTVTLPLLPKAVALDPDFKWDGNLLQHVFSDSPHTDCPCWKTLPTKDCNSCRWAEWDEDSSVGIGNCGYLIPDVPVPKAYSGMLRLYTIRPYEDCPTWAAKEESDGHSDKAQ